MIIAGLQKNTLIDFPGKVACVAFLTGCNFTCPFCHNPELARGLYPQRISTAQFLEFLRPRRTLLDGVVITGGEPTLSAGLTGLCRAIRDLDLAVKLDTNGSRPDVLADLFAQHLVDYVAMDIKTAPSAYAHPLASAAVQPAIAQSIRLIIDSGLDYEFRTTCVRPFVTERLMPLMAQAIEGARRYVLQPFRMSNLLDPGYFGASDPGFSMQAMHHLQQLATPWVKACLVREV